MFVARGREENRGGRGRATMICASTLNTVQRPHSGRLTAGARRQPLRPAEGSPREGDSLQAAAASRGGEKIDLAG